MLPVSPPPPRPSPPLPGIDVPHCHPIAVSTSPATAPPPPVSRWYLFRASAVSPAFPLPYPLPLLAASLVAVFHLWRRSRSPPPPSLRAAPVAAVPSLFGEGAMLIPLCDHASLWAVFCVMLVLYAGRGVLVECLMCSHGRVHSGYGVVVVIVEVISSLPVTSAGRLRVTVLVRCVLSVHRGGGPVGMRIVSWWGCRFRCCSWAFGSGSAWSVCCCFCVCYVLYRSWQCQASVVFSVQHIDVRLWWCG